MNEQALNHSESTLPSVGERLRAAREAKELSIAQAIGDAKLNRHYIQALEDDDFAQLPNAAFVRGYLRRYCALLGLPADAIVKQYDDLHCPSPAPLDGVVAIEKSKQGAQRQLNSLINRYVHGLRWSRLLTVVSVVLIVLLLLKSIFWGTDDTVQPEAIVDTSAEITVAPEVQPATSETVSVATAPELAAAVNADPATATTPAEASPATATANATATVAPAEVVTPAPAATPEVSTPAATPAPTATPALTPPVTSIPAAAAGGDTLTLSFSGKSWVSVRDGTGQELVYGLKKAGQTVSVVGKPPFTINIGSVTATRLQRNGKEVDLKPYQRGDIASFRLGR